MSTVDSKRLKGIRGDGFEIELEYNKDYVLVHIPYLEKFNKGTLLQMQWLLEDWSEFLKQAGYKEIYGVVGEDDTKIIRLGRKLGFKQVGRVPSLRVLRYEGDT